MPPWAIISIKVCAFRCLESRKKWASLPLISLVEQAAIIIEIPEVFIRFYSSKKVISDLRCSISDDARLLPVLELVDRGFLDV